MGVVGVVGVCLVRARASASSGKRAPWTFLTSSKRPSRQMRCESVSVSVRAASERAHTYASDYPCTLRGRKRTNAVSLAKGVAHGGGQRHTRLLRHAKLCRHIQGIRAQNQHRDTRRKRAGTTTRAAGQLMWFLTYAVVAQAEVGVTSTWMK